MHELRVEVVFALPERQRLQAVNLKAGATVADAIASSDIEKFMGSQSLADLQPGIWGKPVRLDQVLSDGDRVEIYRPLLLDPREARRQLALAGRTMAGGESD